MTKEAFVLSDKAPGSRVAIHHRPEQAGETALVIVVGGPQYRVGAHRQFVDLANRAAEAGIEALRFDFSGAGDSDGSYGPMPQRLEELRHATEKLLQRAPKIKRVIYWGLCDAASLLITHHRDLPKSAGLVLANPWVRDDEVLTSAGVQRHYQTRLFSLTQWKRLLSGQVGWTRLATAARALLRLSTGRPIGELASGMQKGFQSYQDPMLIILSGRDLTAQEFEQTVRLSAPWRARVFGKDSAIDITRFGRADHTFSGNWAHRVVAEATLSWIKSLSSGWR